MKNIKSFAWIILSVTILLIVVPFIAGFVYLMSNFSIYIKLIIVGIYVLAILFWFVFITSFERV